MMLEGKRPWLGIWREAEGRKEAKIIEVGVAMMDELVSPSKRDEIPILVVVKRRDVETTVPRWVGLISERKRARKKALLVSRSMMV